MDCASAQTDFFAGIGHQIGHGLNRENLEVPLVVELGDKFLVRLVVLARRGQNRVFDGLDYDLGSIPLALLRSSMLP